MGREFDRAVLERFRPLLRYDAQEPYRAMAGDSIAENPGNVLELGDGTVLARAGDEDGTPLSLALLGDYPEGFEPGAADHLDEEPDVLADARRMQGEDRYR